MPLEKVEKPVASLEILVRFRDNRKDIVVGGRVEEGALLPKQLVKILRNKEVIAEGKTVSIRRGKDEVKTVQTGSECGLELSLSYGAELVKAGDTVYQYQVEEQRKVLGL